MPKKSVGKINVSKLTETINTELKDCAYVWNGAIREGQNKAAEETAAFLRRTSPNAPNGGYAQSWTWDFENRRDKYATIVHAAAPDYRLTHLLEFGHRLIAWGHDTGRRVRAIPHIARAEEYAEDIVVDCIKKAVENA